jgi:pimeloyl-ACP methyl ester carboxylesterase
MMFMALLATPRHRKWLTAAALMGVLAGALPLAAHARSGPIQAGKLAGTLTAPEGKPKATVLIIPGSGPTDRDGNSPLGIRANSYKLLAEALAENGIASVRIDKRGMFGSKAAVADANAVQVRDYVADTGAWVQAARKATGSRCVWIAGHSEGGLVALASAGQPNVCGLILIATAGRPLGTVLREQLRANPANAPLLEPAERAIAELEAGRRVDVAAMHPALAQGLFNPAVQPYLIDLLRHDPAGLIASAKVPVLIVQGDNDLQVSPADARELHAAQPKAQLRIIEGMNHVLKAAPRDRAGNAATYADPDLPLIEGLASAIAAFVEAAK